MIRVESITIKEFRGIRDLTLDFKGKTFAVCGPNGTGKSGIVDALEFVLTGRVSRLSGEGRGDISLKDHGPHVDSRNAPDKARVTVKVTIPSLGKTVTIERNVKTPTVAHVTPSESAVLAVLQQVEAHPEIVLSRRELIRYVLATPGKRAEEVQALLHLDQVEQVRVGLQKVANACERELPPLNTSAVQARDSLLSALGIAELTKDKVLAAVNAQRVTLGLPAVADLTETTSFKDGMATAGPAQPQRIPKAQALADIRIARDLLVEVTSAGTITRVAEAETDLTALVADPAVATGVVRENYYTTGISLIDADACPFCDTTWDLAALKNHVQGKIDHLKEVSRKRQAVETKMAPLISILQRATSALDIVIRYAALAAPPLTMQAVRDYSAASTGTVATLAAFVPMTNTLSALVTVPAVPQSAFEAISEFDKAVAALPEPTKQDSARESLTIAQERLEVYRGAMRRQKAAKEQAVRSREVSNIYAAASDKVLAGVYEDVEKDFASLYSFVNRDDEEKFKAQLVPSMGKLGFDVDFYGRGFFPPGAYHSEGHQDGMGLCLYLALMRYLQGEGFTFAVLDDVLMSVDTGHRREVCALLKKEFPNTQFIVTTHDPVWLMHMRTAGVIASRSAVQFKNWNVSDGPSMWQEGDVWVEIEGRLKQNDVSAAAAHLRRYLEFVARELCHCLRASVGFRGDGQYELGDLLAPALNEMRRLFSSAKDAENSWGHKEKVKEIGDREAAFSKLVDAVRFEQWQVNVAVHFNAWENLTAAEFSSVAGAFRELLAWFWCVECSELLFVTPDRGVRESLRCGCGMTNLNLLKKGA